MRQDGRSASLTAPNGMAQQGLLCAAIVDAQTGADQMAILEAHGTGTALGDPIEAGAVATAILAQRTAGLLGIGSLKANTGHTEPGAGIAGTLRLLMQLEGAALLPNAQLHTLNSHVDDSMNGCCVR